MILREMPAVWDANFRPAFYARWGRENCVISASTRQCEYYPYRQRLSIKAAWGGREDYFVDGRRIAVDDDSFLIMNEGRTYSSAVQSRAPMHSFAIFFRPRMAEDVLRTLTCSTSRLLDEPRRANSAPPEFSEHLRPHDRTVTPVLKYIRRCVDAGVEDEAWYEEQLYFLLKRMLTLHREDLRAVERVPAVRHTTRKELYRRTGRAVDFMNTHFTKQIGLEEIAAAALLSPYHCLRVFKAVRGCTPREFLAEKRIQVAERLLASTSMQLDDVAALAGFQNRTSLFRAMKRLRGIAPGLLRAGLRHPG